MSFLKPSVLVACEESQAVTIALREKGIRAYSCDIDDCSGNHPEWHIKADVLPILNGNTEFVTADNVTHRIVGRWDMIIAFPPCTYLTVAGNRAFKNNPDRLLKRYAAFDFVMKIANADCDHIAIENPVGYLNTHYRKPDQIIHPYYFGYPALKRTCLWLKNIPKLEYTNMLDKPGPMRIDSRGKNVYFTEGMKGSGKSRSKARSKTFPEIAKAMADQWGIILFEGRY